MEADLVAVVAEAAHVAVVDHAAADQVQEAQQRHLLDHIIDPTTTVADDSTAITQPTDILEQNQAGAVVI